MKKNLPRIVLGLLLLLGMVGHAAKWYQVPLLTIQDAFFYDARLRSSMPGGVDDRIVIVDLDEKSFAEVGRWPWGRDKLAQLVDRLFDEYQIKLLGFDVVFAEPDESSGLKVLERLGEQELKGESAFQGALTELRQSLDYDKRFADALRGRPVVLGYFHSGLENTVSTGVLPSAVLPAGTFFGRNLSITSWPDYTANLAQLQAAAMSAGHFLPLPDSDGVIRRVPLLAEHNGAYYEALSLAMVRVMLGESTIEPGFVKAIGKDYSGLEWLEIKSPRGVLRVPVDEHAAALVPFRGYQGSFRYVSASDVLAGRLPKDSMTDRIVLLGTTARGLFDLRSSPVGEAYAGVEMHANLIAGMLDDSIMSRPAYIVGAEATMLVVLGLSLIFLLMRLSPLYSTLLAAGALLVVWGISYATWQSGLVMPVASSLWLVIGIYVLNMAWGYFVESRSKRQFADLFGQYVPPELVDEMAKDPEQYSMEGRNAELTVLFSDVRGFTTLSEGLGPKDLSDLMNTYLGAMTDVIRQRRGTLDKYVGDMIMAFWGAPVSDADHARNAVLAGLEMQATLRTLDEPFKAKGWPPLHIGVGISTGMMTVGDMGSHVRRAYTVLGDSVNLGSRLESITKKYGVGILVSEATRDVVKDVFFREIDRVRVKGKDVPVGIFEPIGLQDDIGKAVQDEMKLWHQTLRAYRSQDWDQADMNLLNLQRMAPASKLYVEYEKRVAHLRSNPPGEGWDGVTTFETK